MSLKGIFVCLLPLISLSSPTLARAVEKNQFITVVNPVRISRYTTDIAKSLTAQYSVISEQSLSATWLLTYDVVDNDEAYLILFSMDNSQELGIFLEVTPDLTKAAGVKYNDSGSWHHATSVFLSGYTQEERKRMIDTLFELFKNKFGVYPISVGAWWTDSFSLSYMKEKYGITANLGVSDQFSTDGYQVWGQYWSSAFYPSHYHAGIPAASVDVKLDLVTIQWAPRDPLNGYYSSLYSTQDYKVVRNDLDIGYFSKLIDLYAKKHANDFGQITVGLEGDLPSGVYTQEFEKQINVVSTIVKSGKAKDLTMQQFSSWYRQSFPELSPVHFIESEDLLSESGKRVFWYQSPRYRIGILHDSTKKETKIFDLRTFHEDFQEPFYFSPNREFELPIYIPSYFDEINNSEDVWQLSLGSFQGVKRNGDTVVINFDSGKKIILEAEKITLPKTDIIPEVLLKSSALTVNTGNELEIIPNKNWIVGKEGMVFTDLSLEVTHFLAGRKIMVLIGLGALMFFGGSTSIIFSKRSDKFKLILLTLIIFPTFAFVGIWYTRNTANYFVSQGERDALFRLSVLPEGKVVVVDRECLQCFFEGKVRPAVFANKRNYVEKFGKHKIIYNFSVFGAKDQEQAKQEFDKLDAKYIYLVKYEDYIEKPPFSPGDLGIEKIYDNANAEIWRVK